MLKITNGTPIFKIHPSKIRLSKGVFSNVRKTGKGDAKITASLPGNIYPKPIRRKR
jgi:hypothetical protein